MVAILDTFNDACTDSYAAAKFFIYSLPVFACAYLYISGNTYGAYTIAIPTAVLLLTLLSCGINNIFENKQEILTFNIIFIFSTAFRLCLSVIPVAIAFGLLGYLIISLVKIPDILPWLPVAFNSIVLVLMFSIIMTSYLLFSKKMSIAQAYNLKAISNSAIDVLVSIIFMVIQLVIIDAVLGGIVWYIFFFYKIPYTNPVFIFYCSILLILNISMMAGYLAQIAYENVKSSDDDQKYYTINK